MTDDESSADPGATEGAARKVDSGGAWSLEYDVPGKGWTNAAHMTAEDHLAIADLLKSGALPASFLRKVGEYPMPPDIPAGLRDLWNQSAFYHRGERERFDEYADRLAYYYTDPENPRPSLNAQERAVWAAWDALGGGSPAPVKTIARQLGMEPADVAFIVYPAETFGRWTDEDEPDLDEL